MLFIVAEDQARGGDGNNYREVVVRNMVTNAAKKCK